MVRRGVIALRDSELDSLTAHNPCTRVQFDWLHAVTETDY